VEQSNPKGKTAKAVDGPKCLFGTEAEDLGDYVLTPAALSRKRGEENEVYDL
jgi:hypothetical protein